MEPRAFLDLASELLATEDQGSAGRRTSVSRAYYAAYHTAARLVSTLGIALPSDDPLRRPGDDHAFVYRCLRRCGDAEMAALATELASLRDDRTLADYALADADAEAPEVALACVAVARSVIEGVEGLMADGGNRRLRAKRRLQELQRQGRL